MKTEKKKLEDIAMKHISNQTALKVFLKYCKNDWGEFPYSKVEEEKVEICLENFKKDKPQYAQYVS